ncbi:small ribosomal subunit protein mS47-like [Phragmites australis]|uniref:small ribosomal subunit protein mS47-like n=1 Tax=Phragmites australis TaxID=29695 RepID=UPI002D77B47D|nr:small ribosomal subunit protein mS47-like [Phragmites australis]
MELPLCFKQNLCIIVAILDGVTMGGGGGVSIPGTFHIATDRIVFSTLEVHIGFHPDAADSFYLSHLTGHVGEYLALNGEKPNGADIIALGLATHYSISSHVDLVDERVAKLVTDDPSVIDSSLSRYGDMVYPDKTSIVKLYNDHVENKKDFYTEHLPHRALYHVITITIAVVLLFLDPGMNITMVSA